MINRVTNKKQVTLQIAITSLAFSFELFLGWLLNTTLFSAYDSVFPEARDISMVLVVVAGIFLTILATRRPQSSIF